MHRSLEHIRHFTARAVLATAVAAFPLAVMLFEESEIAAAKSALWQWIFG